MLENVRDTFTYLKDDGTEATMDVIDGLSGTARRLSQQIDGRLVDIDGHIAWDDTTRKRLVDLTRLALEAEYKMFLAAWEKVYGSRPK